MFISIDSYERLLDVYSACVSTGLLNVIPSQQSTSELQESLRNGLHRAITLGNVRPILDLFETVGEVLNEVEHFLTDVHYDMDDGDSPEDDYNELKEHEDFAQDGYFENHEPNEDGFWS